ncbi:type II toxin-antitoxin system HipA family toxin [Corticibacter populi]|uniref:Type II toxin-antitoxin system HipA family toxin n=1 Tax=Corticibacter populi TaxID=1550736 RepID=A0A3M6QZ44_9BURK|nr:HipA domain-containing protein [Corticibacter populi]RMX08173.1 type II toxin-antitoxin system HipA family toxin [Corticibacter populi]RZS35437.1 serine/threonine-protein kinase HipA [Corticibacter populi]
MKSCTLQLHCQDQWHDVASVSLWGNDADGWRAKTFAGYAVDWSVRHFGQRDAHPISVNWPVGLEPLESPHWPVWLLDMLPQGFGRAELLQRLDLPVTLEQAADWRLLQAGAGNPIGHLRVKEAAEWLQARTDELQQHTGSIARGFATHEVSARVEAFSEHLAQHGLFVAGSSGVQGEWPKLLLTQDDVGLLHLDHTLPDAQAARHFIVKFSRGRDAALAQILRHEPVYMELARRLGLRVHASLKLEGGRVLFIPRFDRSVVAADGARRVERLAQESVASLTGYTGLDRVPSHDEVCRALVAHCSDPQTEVLEYLRRDVVNLALGNKDNHARNTAIQRDFAGHIRLTPLYDFAPMYLHPDGIARSIRWEGNDHGQPDWKRVLDAVCSPANDPEERLDCTGLAAGLAAMAPALAEIAEQGAELGLEPDVHAYLRPGLASMAERMRALA